MSSLAAKMAMAKARGAGTERAPRNALASLLLKSSQSGPIRYGLAFIFGGLITLILFLLMTLLIRFDYIDTVPTKLEIVPPAPQANIDYLQQEQALKKRQEETQKLKQAVTLPPALATKTAPNRQERPRRQDVQVSFKPHFDTLPLIDLNIGLPASIQKPGTSKSYGLNASGMHKDRGAGSADGALKCTIIFTVGETADQIAEMKWVECMSGSIANDAETALYQWVSTGSKDYYALKPVTGDEIEFTYKR